MDEIVLWTGASLAWAAFMAAVWSRNTDKMFAFSLLDASNAALAVLFGMAGISTATWAASQSMFHFNYTFLALYCLKRSDYDLSLVLYLVAAVLNVLVFVLMYASGVEASQEMALYHSGELSAGVFWCVFNLTGLFPFITIAVMGHLHNIISYPRERFVAPAAMATSFGFTGATPFASIVIFILFWVTHLMSIGYLWQRLNIMRRELDKLATKTAKD